MSQLKPIYTFETCKPAYQLRWSLALFPNQTLPCQSVWFDALQSAVEKDGVRILDFQARAECAQFLLSTTPLVHPPAIVKSVKGRLQACARPIAHVAFGRNFRLTSVGDANLDTVQAYVNSQLDHHPLASQYSQANIENIQVEFPEVDLSAPQNSAHGQYITAMHLVLVHAGRWRTGDVNFLSVTRDVALACAARNGHRISRLRVLPDHVHVVMGIDYEDSPTEIALAYMNDIAYRHSTSRLWMDGFYVGTIGPYDMSAVRRGSS